MSELKAEIIGKSGIIANKPKTKEDLETKLKEAKESKLIDIKASWSECDQGPCHTGIFTSENRGK